MRKSLMEKFDRKPQIADIPPKMVKKYGSGKMLIPSPCLLYTSDAADE